MKHTSYQSLRWQWEHSSRKTAQTCGKIPIDRTGYVDVYHSPHDTYGGKYHFGGLVKCGSAAICTNCSQEFAQRRVAFTEAVFQKATNEGYEIKLVTLTSRHHLGTPLDDLLTVMSRGFSHVLASHTCKKLRKDNSMKYIRTLEITYGDNGYHPHFHVAFLVPTGTFIDYDQIFNDWSSFITASGFEAPNRDNGLHLSQVQTNAEALSSYLTKERSMAHLELAGGIYKRGRGDSLSIWEIRSMAERGDSWALGIWNEYERAVSGVNFFTYSRSIKSAWALSPSLYIKSMDDSELELEFICSIKAPLWKHLIKHNRLFEFLNNPPVRQLMVHDLRMAGYPPDLVRAFPSYLGYDKAA